MAQDSKTKRRPKRKSRYFAEKRPSDRFFSQKKKSDRHFSQGEMPTRDGRGLRRK